METNTLQLPLKSLAKKEITTEVQNWLNSALEHMAPDELYVLLKQMEFAIEEGLGDLKVSAFQAAQERFKGAKGNLLEHEVQLVSSSEWIYSADLDKFKDRQKKELKVEQLKEQASGVAKNIPKGQQIKVTLKD